MIALKGDKEIGDKLGKGKDMQDRLSNLVGIFENPGLDFSGNRAEGDNILGDAYEYLMRHFATESGKSKGQFYTPAEVSRIMAQVIGISQAKSQSQTIYDPACGSGSLLLKAADEARTGVTIYGQEMDNATSALAKMNMILHSNPTAEIWNDNSLSNPHFMDKSGNLKTFDFVVANPPFSTKAWSNGFDPASDPYERFTDGVPPDKNGDYAFLLHILRSLKSTGKGAVILPHGVLFRGNAEGNIRRNVLRKGYIKGIIGLPANLFYGTGIPACILVLDKEHAHARSGVFMIDASKGFVKDGNKNRLRAQDIHKIVDAFTKQAEVPGFSRLVPLAEISNPKNDFNLNLPRYIDSTEAEDVQDIAAHLHGGIPDRDIDALGRYWQVLPSVRAGLFGSADRPGYSALLVPAGDINAAIFGHAEFKAFNQTVSDRFAQWKAANLPAMKGIAIGSHPKELIKTLAESLLSTFQATPLLDAYDVYQHLMSYWADIMQDDTYLLAMDGWKAVVAGKPNTDLIPTPLVVSRYFAAEALTVENLEAARDAVSRQLEELNEEQGGEEGLLAEAKTDSGKLTKVSINVRLKVIQSDPDAAEEDALLRVYRDLLEEEAQASKKAKDAQRALDARVLARYPRLTDEEAKTLVVDDKWLAALAAAGQSELDRVSQALTGRVRQLAERYAVPLPELICEVEALAARVDVHLKQMGAAWK